MKKIGLTGNIGSGKSTVARIFRVLGAPVFHADAEAKKLYDNKEVLQEVVDAFGAGVLGDEGRLDKVRLAEVVFGDKEHLQTINHIIHPRVRKRYQEWLQHNEKAPYTVMESAIMTKSDLYRQMDVVVVVTAPLSERLQRVAKRDGFNKEQILRRMESQHDEATLRTYADYVVENEENSMVIPQVMHIHQELLKA